MSIKLRELLNPSHRKCKNCGYYKIELIGNYEAECKECGAIFKVIVSKPKR